MEQAERGMASRSQNVVHFLPRTTDALARVITPALERIDASQPSLQLVLVTPDPETAVIAADVVTLLTGAQGIEMLPVTSANRAARMLGERPVHAIAGPAVELQTLIQRSAIKLDDLRTIVLAWVDDDIAESPAALAALESLFGELPKTTTRLMIARRSSADAEKIIDAHLRTARRMVPADADVDSHPQIAPATPPIHYVSVSAASRPAALRRVLDDLDPPSATIVVRDAASEADALQTVRSLGYRRNDDPIRVARYGDIPASHTIILYDAPVMPSEIASAIAVGPVQIVALAAPRDMIPLHELSDSLLPLTLAGPGSAARSRDALLREELALILSQGVATREMLALEPLLDRYDGIEIAAAAIRLLEVERVSQAAPARQNLRLMVPRPAAAQGSQSSGQSGQSGQSSGHGTRNIERGGRQARPVGARDRGPHDMDTRSRDFRGPPRGVATSTRNRPGSAPEHRDEGKQWARRPPRDTASGPAGERRERNLGRGPRSGGGGGRDDRDGSGGRTPRRPPRG